MITLVTLSPACVSKAAVQGTMENTVQIVSWILSLLCFSALSLVLLARLYESTGRAIAVTPASVSVSALASALLKMLKFLVKVFIRLYLLNMLMD